MAAILQRIFADAIFCIKITVLIQFSVKCVPKGLINNIPALVLMMAWCRAGDKPLSEPMMARVGASTRFTSLSKSKSTCSMCEYQSESEYLIIAWVRVRIGVLIDESESEYRSMIYSLYKPQYCIFQSLKRESSDSYKPGTKLHV